MTYASIIEGLEKNFIYELCHIPVYHKNIEIPPGLSKSGEKEISYFSFDEIKVMIDEAMKRNYTEPAIYFFVTSSLLSIVAKDIRSGNSRSSVLYGDNLAMIGLHQNLNRLIKEYRSLLFEMMHDSCNLCVGKIIKT